jgi:response regulator of citrate/malate metabolism
MGRDWFRLRKWYIRMYNEGWGITKICSHAQISRMSFYRYLEYLKCYFTLKILFRQKSIIAGRPIF